MPYDQPPEGKMQTPPDHKSTWLDFLKKRHDKSMPSPGSFADIFGPLLTPSSDGLMVIGQIGQSIDGRIATHTGHSKYINGKAGLEHLHRLRACVDAVVIGVGTAVADDPMLTVRLVEGAHPARVLIDPRGRVPVTSKMFAQDGARSLVITTQSAFSSQALRQLPEGVEVIILPEQEGRIPPSAILRALADRGLCRILVEGGANTVSTFMLAGCMDRLHVMVAPVILGSGRPGFELPLIDRVDQALRPVVFTHLLDGEVLFDCDLSAQRLSVK